MNTNFIFQDFIFMLNLILMRLFWIPLTREKDRGTFFGMPQIFRTLSLAAVCALL